MIHVVPKYGPPHVTEGKEGWCWCHPSYEYDCAAIVIHNEHPLFPHPTEPVQEASPDEASLEP